MVLLLSFIIVWIYNQIWMHIVAHVFRNSLRQCACCWVLQCTSAESDAFLHILGSLSFWGKKIWSINSTVLNCNEWQRRTESRHVRTHSIHSICIKQINVYVAPSFITMINLWLISFVFHLIWLPPYAYRDKIAGRCFFAATRHYESTNNDFLVFFLLFVVIFIVAYI